jgi:cbb3-type cytochrome oxidase subunit 3
MDTNDFRILVTLAGLCLFITLMLWAWRPARRSDHEQAAQLPFLGDAEWEAQGLRMKDARHE